VYRCIRVGINYNLDNKFDCNVYIYNNQAETFVGNVYKKVLNQNEPLEQNDTYILL